jgi:Secretion system C-terminal sorting domain
MKLYKLLLFFPLVIYSQWNAPEFANFGLETNLQMGTSTAINSNGNVVAVAAINNYANYLGMPENAGYVDVFQNNNGTWASKGTRIKGNLFRETSGTSISLNADGNILAIGSPNANASTNADGRVRVYQFNGTDWELLGNIINGGQQYALFGYSLKLNSAGNVLVVGVPGANLNNVITGQVRIYELNGNVWQLKGNTLYGDASEDLFGISSDINANGDIIIVGAYDNDFAGFNKGKVTTYQYNSGTWNPIGSPLYGEYSYGQFGNKVLINQSGNRIAISEKFFGANSNQYGQTKIYEYISNNWAQKGSAIIGDNIGDMSGECISFNADGTQIAISDTGFNNGGNNRGRVRVFNFQNNNWTVGSTILGEEDASDFGFSIALNATANKMVVGAPKSNLNGTLSGYGAIYSQATLSAISNKTEPNFIAYPNPTKLYVNLKNNSLKKIIDIQIFDNLGRLISTEKSINKIDYTLDFSSLNSGIYIAKVFFHDTFETIKIEKN